MKKIVFYVLILNSLIKLSQSQKSKGPADVMVVEGGSDSDCCENDDSSDCCEAMGNINDEHDPSFRIEKITFSSKVMSARLKRIGKSNRKRQKKNERNRKRQVREMNRRQQVPLFDNLSNKGFAKSTSKTKSSKNLTFKCLSYYFKNQNNIRHKAKKAD